MLRKYGNFSFRNDAPNRITFHHPNRLIDMQADIAEHFATTEARRGFPDQIHEFHDVFVVPGSQKRCLYDNQGRQIIESCLKRDRGGTAIYWNADEQVTLPSHYVTIDEPQLYQSELFDHWGHFLIESTSRLWARYAHPELAKLESLFLPHWNRGGYNANILQFIERLHPPLKLRDVPGPARIMTCFVPAASFSESVEGYTGHLASMHDVAGSILRQSPPERGHQPVYLSRSLLRPSGPSPRVIVNEVEFESVLSKGGFKIVHAEEMSLEQQISLFNSHDVFVGCKGSALHNIAYCLRGGDITTYTICGASTPKTGIIMDALVGNTSNYIGVLNPVEVGQFDVRQLAIDIDAAVTFFRDVGLI